MDITTILYVGAIIGLLDTAYLIYHKWKGTDVACPFFPSEWCHTVQRSPQSKTFGIPNSYLGFVMYAGIFLLTWLYNGMSVEFWTVQALVTFGFLFSMYFTYIQKYVLRAFCTWCVLSAINLTILFITVWFF